MVPRHSRETERPLRPRCVYCMGTTLAPRAPGRRPCLLSRIDRSGRPEPAAPRRGCPGTLAAVPPTGSASSDFDAATAVTRTEGGGLLAELDPGWDVGGGILNGGYLLAVAARAAVLAGPHPHPVALSASYLRATAPGPAAVAVTPGTTGRTLAHATVALVTDAGPTLQVQATTATLGADDVPQWSSPAP